MDWWRWQFEKTKLFEFIAGDDMDEDVARITQQWAKVMDKYDALHNNQIMRWNMVTRRNLAQADDLRIW